MTSLVLAIVVLHVVAALSYWLLRLELGLRLHRRQIIRLINHHNNLRERFELFMHRAGNELVKQAFEKEWAKSQCLCKVDTSNSYTPMVPHFSTPVSLGPIEDPDTVAAIPPFVQASAPWTKNVEEIKTVTE